MTIAKTTIDTMVKRFAGLGSGVRKNDLLALYRPLFERMQEQTTDIQKIAAQNLYWKQIDEIVIQQAIPIYVTPELAIHWLREATAKDRRNLNPKALTRLERKVNSGNFCINHQAIAFDQQGILCDGHHRLSTIVATGIGVWLWALFGLTEEAIYSIDRGTARTADQDLMMRGMSRTKERLSLLRICIEMLGHISTFVFDYEDYMKWLPVFGDAVDFALPLKNRMKKTAKKASVVGAFAFAYSTNPARVAASAERFVRQSYLADNSPELVLIKYVDEPKNFVRGQKARADMARSVLNAIHAAVKKKKITKLDATQEGMRFFRAHYLTKHGPLIKQITAFDKEPKPKKKASPKKKKLD